MPLVSPASLWKPRLWKTICYSTSCPSPGPGSKGSSSWTALSTAVQVAGGVVVFMGLSNFFSFCRQDCPCGYRSSVPQRPLCDGDSRIPCGQKQRSEPGMHAYCRRRTESRWVKGKGTRIGRRERPWERMVSSSRVAWGSLGRTEARRKFASKASPWQALDTDRGDVCWSPPPVHLLSAAIWSQGPHTHCRALFASFRPHINSPFSSLCKNLPVAHSFRRSCRVDLLSFDQPTHRKISVAILVHILQWTDLKAKLCARAILGQKSLWSESESLKEAGLFVQCGRCLERSLIEPSHPRTVKGESLGEGKQFTWPPPPQTHELLCLLCFVVSWSGARDAMVLGDEGPPAGKWGMLQDGVDLGWSLTRSGTLAYLNKNPSCSR